jgi:hypothetical protein
MPFVPPDAVGLVLAHIVPSEWQEHVGVRAGEAAAPARKPRDQAPQVVLSRPPHSQSTNFPEARSQAFQIQNGSDFQDSPPLAKSLVACCCL